MRPDWANKPVRPIGPKRRPLQSLLGQQDDDDPPRSKHGNPWNPQDDGSVKVPKVVQVGNLPEELADELADHGNIMDQFQDALPQNELVDPPPALEAIDGNIDVPDGDEGDDQNDNGDQEADQQPDPGEEEADQQPDPGEQEADQQPDPGEEEADQASGAVVVVHVPGLGAVVSVGHGRPAIARPGFVWGPGYWVPAPGDVAQPAAAAVAVAPIDVPANVLPEDQETVELVPVILLNDEPNAAAVAFLLAGELHELESGEQLEVEVPTGTLVQFDRGGGFGPAEYALSAGVYRFKLTDRGWDLFRRTFQVVLDNAANDVDFHYVADGHHAVVAAGETQTHEGRFPVVIAFDRGDGQAAQMALDSGRYLIGVNPDTGLWDLFLDAE